MAGQFWKVRCPDCSNEQVAFSRAASQVDCLACGTTLLTPTGGEATAKAEILSTLE